MKYTVRCDASNMSWQAETAFFMFLVPSILLKIPKFSSIRKPSSILIEISYRSKKSFSDGLVFYVETLCGQLGHGFFINLTII